MKKALFIIFFLSSILIKAQIIINKVDLDSIPTGISFEGEVQQAGFFQYLDKDYFLINTKKTNIDKYGSSVSDLISQCYYKSENDWIANWRIVDYIDNCEKETDANFLLKELKVTDLDKNGVPEIWTMYQLGCLDTFSPKQQKLIVYEGSKKMVAKVELKSLPDKQIEESKIIKFDAPFKNSSSLFRDEAILLWQKFEK